MDYVFADNISSLKASAIREILKFSSLPGFISFSAGNPAPEAFPVEDVKRITNQIITEDPILALQYSVTEGFTPLKNEIKKFCSERYDIGDYDNDELLITSGAQQVMDLVSKSICNNGDSIICEEPSFIGSLNCFRSYGLKLIGVPVENDGMNIEILKEKLSNNPNVKFIYTIPNFQNPSGVVMSLEKRKQLYELAKQYNVPIIEDNPYGELRFRGEDVPCLKSFDTDGIVIYAGSFSKILSPGLRIGYAIADKNLIGKMTVCKQTVDVHTTIFSQLIAYKFMTECDFYGHLDSLKKIYKKKANLMLGEMEKQLKPKGITWFDVNGGLFIWCTLPEKINMLEFCTNAANNKVGIVPGTAFLTNPEELCHCFRMNFSTPTDEQIVEGVSILSNLL